MTKEPARVYRYICSKKMTSCVPHVTLPCSWQAGTEQLSMPEAMTELKQAQEMAAKAQKEAKVAAQDLAAANAKLERAHVALEAAIQPRSCRCLPLDTDSAWMLKTRGDEPLIGFNIPMMLAQ